MELPKSAIALDRRLDKATESSTEELCQHRWHWTLDETNPKRVSIRQYALGVGRARTTVGPQVNGYAMWVGGGRERSLTECIERARHGAEKEAAIEAVAKASGQSYTNTRQRHGETVRTTRALAEERAQRRGTSVADEIDDAADHLVKSAKAIKNQKADRKSKLDARYIEIEGHIAAALRRLRDALEVARAIEFDSEQVEILADSISKLRAVINLIDVQVTGTTDVDWDAELAKL